MTTSRSWKFRAREQLAKRKDIQKRIAKVEDGLLKKNPELPKRQAVWEEKERTNAVEWAVLNPDSFYGALGTKLDAQSDGSLLATASSPGTSTYTVTSKTRLTNITAFRLEAMTDPEPAA